ncbi:DMT family protein [Arachidicoccus sp.]|uniref:DMT family protein n=1 Tax=Arachidicoccus sp. TaxID=1872624 RepID=UPI003D1F030C
MRTFLIVILLVFSNIFMTTAWYWHLKPGFTNVPIWKIILISWGIAIFEYCLTVPANHYGNEWGISPFKLKIIQEVVTLVVFTFFAVFYLKQPFHWKYLVSFAFILGAVYFAFKQ